MVDKQALSYAKYLKEVVYIYDYLDKYNLPKQVYQKGKSAVNPETKIDE